MIVTDVSSLLAQCESTFLEFKGAAPDHGAIVATVCAFANTAGGDLIIGVEDGTRAVAGIDADAIVELEEKVAALIAQGVVPRVVPIIRIANLGGRFVLDVHVERGCQRPYRVAIGKQRDHVFVRVGSSTRVADQGTVERLARESHGGTWDTLPCAQVSVTDLDRELINDFLRLRYERRRLPRPSSVPGWLKKQRLCTDMGGRSVATMAGVLLFHAEPESIVPHATLELACFEGTSAKTFVDKASAGGPVWRHLDLALAFARKHLPLRAERHARGRVERLAYPEVALREFVVNALCHRSYEASASPVRLAIFDDLIEITSSGTLPDGLELSDLGRGISMLRNPVLSRAFNEIGLIEGWGTGISVAQQELAQAGLPPARILLKGFFTQVSSPWRWPDALDERERQVSLHVASHGSINTTAATELLACSERTARAVLARLVKRDVLVRLGKTKSATYRLR